MSTSPIVELENLLGAQITMASLGLGDYPVIAGRYSIRQLRGRGARGVVCRAHDIKLDRAVALKIYPPVE